MPKTIDEKIESGRSYRMTQGFSIRSSGEEGKKTVSGYATTFNEPYVLREYTDSWDGYRITIREQVDAHAFDECDMSDVIMQYNHEGRVFARLSNQTLRIKADEHGLYCEADLEGTEIGRQLYEEIRGGYTNKMSFGFTVDEQTRESKEDTERKTYEVLRTIKKIGKLYDVSAVSIPANGATDISARIYSDGVKAEIEKELLERRTKKENIEKLKLKLRLMED